MDIKSTPIDALNLSTRSYNCLRRNGVCTIGELVALSEEEIFSMKNLGKKSAEEVFQKINEYFGEPDRDNEDTEQNDPVGMIKLSALSDDCKKAVTDILTSRNVKISDIDPLPSKAYNRLMINGFIAFSEIVFMDEDDLMTIPGMDRETASCIEKCCMEYLENDNEIINIIGEISNVSKG